MVRVAGDAVVEARAGYLSVNEVPTVVDLTAALARGLDDATLAEAGELALDSLEPGGDIHATAAYRAQLVRVLTARVLRSAHDDALGRSAMSEQLHDVRLVVNGAAHDISAAGTPAAVRRAAPRPGADRHPRRLRARSVRRVHGARGRPTRCGRA